MAGIGTSLVEAFDYVWDRFAGRLEGLEDAEYLWEPVAGCWTLRPGPDGRWTLDGNGLTGGPAADDAPVTTIAWRIGHVTASAVGGFAHRLFPGAPAPADLELPGTAAAVPDFLAATYRPWHQGLVATSDERWWAPLGRAWGPYARSTRVDLVLHVFDEVVHHSAEIALLRDLHRNRATLGR